MINEVKWRVYDNSFDSWIGRKELVQVSGNFPEPKFSRGRVKVELDLSSYATKVDLKNAAGVETSKFIKKKLIQLIQKLM